MWKTHNNILDEKDHNGLQVAEGREFLENIVEEYMQRPASLCHINRIWINWNFNPIAKQNFHYKMELCQVTLVRFVIHQNFKKVYPGTLLKLSLLLEKNKSVPRYTFFGRN